MAAHDWSLVGAREPFFGVLSAPEFKSAALTPEAVDRFYETGVHEIAALRRWCLDDLGAAPGEGDALDFGCGVGRLTFAMAGAGARVIGYDVSPEMLAHARTRAGAQTSPHFTSVFPDGRWDWINSYIVFQHIPPTEGLALLKSLLQCANSGAIITLHFTFWRDAARAEPRKPIARLMSALQRMRVRQGRGPAETLIRMHDYNLTEVVALASGAGFSRIVLRMTNHDGHHGAWLLARRNG